MDKEVEWNRFWEVERFIDELGELVALPVQWDHKFLGGECIGCLGRKYDRVRRHRGRRRRRHG